MTLVLPNLAGTQNRPPAQANSTLLKTLYVLANGSEVKTDFSLVTGINYTIRLSGTWVWGGCDPNACPDGGPTYFRVADAAYLSEDHFQNLLGLPWSNVVYLEINGSGVDLGPYNANHVYTTQIVGNGSQASFKLRDCSFCFGDNAGSLRVEIFEGSASEVFDAGAPVFQQRSQLAPNDPNYSVATWKWGENFMGAVSESDEFLCNTQPFAFNQRFCTYGCLVTAWAMLIERWGQQYDFHTTPAELNKWLCENGGYVNGAYLVPHKPAEYVRQKTGRPFVDFNVPGRNETRLHNLIYAGYPVILGVNNHFILATGERVSSQGKTWFINDPGGCSANIYSYPLTTLQERYGNTYSAHKWGFELSGGSGLASLSIGLASPAELLITDPEGLRTGVDPRTGETYNENPDAYYYGEQLTADDGSGESSPPIKWFDTTAPINGDYQIQVIGTGSGPYHMFIQVYDAEGNPTSQVFESQIDIGEEHSYSVNFSDTPLIATFSDVPTSHWAWQYIERLHSAGITGGCAVNPLRYCPQEMVTRAQMAVFLERGIHGPAYAPPDVGGSTGFADVPASYWAAAFIKQLAADGITSGCGSGTYCPESPVTRAQMAVFLLRSKYGASYTPPEIGAGTGFGDVPASYWAAGFIKQLVAEGITVGCGGGNYCPESPVTRDQMAVFLVRTFSLP
jgi:hypothetical protein